MWKANFGITVDWWDRVFGTYEKVEWRREKSMRDHGLGALFRITWLFRKNDALPQATQRQAAEPVAESVEA